MPTVVLASKGSVPYSCPNVIFAFKSICPNARRLNQISIPATSAAVRIALMTCPAAGINSAQAIRSSLPVPFING
ncbi:hypothetical protein ACFOG5_00015 [Pedobacter fastidiosus]|uniref:hypothetical protein n=1 Tax=Pedobacter fastidiosus TaxID=2765361 RepID=UPI0036210187